MSRSVIRAKGSSEVGVDEKRTPVSISHYENGDAAGCAVMIAFHGTLPWRLSGTGGGAIEVWRSEHRYLPQQSDISSVVYWYQAEPHAPFPKLPSKNDLEVN